MKADKEALARKDAKLAEKDSLIAMLRAKLAKYEDECTNSQKTEIIVKKD